MMHDDRREFLKRLAAGAVYAAPVVRTLTAPFDALAQGQSWSHKGGHGHEGHGGHGPPWAGSPDGGADLGGPPPGAQPAPGGPPPP